MVIHFYTICGTLWRAKDGIALNNLTTDFLTTISSAGIMLLFNAFGFVTFIFLPQGRDVLRIIAEDVAEFRWGNLIWLLIGTLIWGLFSEFGVRYAIYVTDNSGNNLSDARVKWRKALQNAIADFFLILPFLIIITGLIKNHTLENITSSIQVEHINTSLGFLLPLTSIYLLLCVVSYLYFDEDKANKIKWWQKFILTGKEKEWTEKLTGIYNDHVFFVQKSSNFEGSAKNDIMQFEENFKFLSEAERNEFPKSDQIASGSQVPNEFILIKYTEDYTIRSTANTSDGIIDVNENPAGRYRWVYFIPNVFYKTLHRKLFYIITLSISFFVLMLIMPLKWYQHIGAPALLILSFACWIGIYLWVLYVDYAIFRRGKPRIPGGPVIGMPNKYQVPIYDKTSTWKGRLSLRFILIGLFIITSIVNDDHLIPDNNAGHIDLRSSLNTHFDVWMQNYIKDSVNSCYAPNKDSTGFYPVVFVCAEGGALRTGAFASMMLGIIQDSLKLQNIDFSKSIYAFSGVSGGSLGISLFNAITYLDEKTSMKTFSYREVAKRFFNNDYLAPALGKLLYGDLLNLIIPFHVEKFDRAIALEQIWQNGYLDITGNNHFANDYLNTYHLLDSIKGISSYPALFINTTEVETGRQCWLSNVRPGTDIFYGEERDLLANKIQHGISYSTMINFSTRFPLVSPGACLKNGSQKLHYVDGGYVENRGVATMTEVLKSLKSNFDTFGNHGFKIKPYVISIQYSKTNEVHKNINFGNEFSEILYAIYNTRSARVEMAKKELKFLIDEMKGEVIEIPLEEDKVPLNWVLSNEAINYADSFVMRTWKKRGTNELSRLYFLTCKQLVAK